MRRAGDCSTERVSDSSAGRIGDIEDRPRAWARCADSPRDGSASISSTRAADSVPASAAGTEYGHPIASNSGANLREYAIAIAGTPVERAFRQACMRAPIRTREPAMIARASSRPRGAKASRSLPNSAVSASTAGASLSRSWESRTCGSSATERDRSSSIRTIAVTVSRYARASTCGFSCQSRPETLRMTSRRSATGSGGAMAKARSLVTASTGRPSAAAAAALTGSRAKTSAERCRERRPSIRPDTDLKGPIVCGAMTTGRPVWAANSWTVDITECRCDP